MGQATKRKKMKPWSISTTVRNPARIAEFLGAFTDGFDEATSDMGRSTKRIVIEREKKYVRAANQRIKRPANGH